MTFTVQALVYVLCSPLTPILPTSPRCGRADCELESPGAIKLDRQKQKRRPTPNHGHGAGRWALCLRVSVSAKESSGGLLPTSWRRGKRAAEGSVRKVGTEEKGKQGDGGESQATRLRSDSPSIVRSTAKVCLSLPPYDRLTCSSSHHPRTAVSDHLCEAATRPCALRQRL